MNLNTGKLEWATAEEIKARSLVEMAEAELTKRQLDEMQVSKFDNRSYAGKKFLSCRQEAKLENLRKQKRKARKKAKQKSRNK